MKRRTVLSLEQALALPYATLRFVQLGWRVIRIEAVTGNSPLPGDPNRYIGQTIADHDRRSYFVAPNVGKEAIALDLKKAEGQAVMKDIIESLGVDIFCCNTLPARYDALGISYSRLKEVKPDIIWAAVSAMGPEHPDRPGYDPALQAMVGFMELTGDPAGPPMLSGIPLIDLKAGDEVYANVCLALAERAETGEGRAIHVSMLQAAASWLITTLPLIDFDCDPTEVTRCGNEHRKFVPVNAYPTAEGFVFIAIGNDAQWERFVHMSGFESLERNDRVTNSGRSAARVAIHREVSAITANFGTEELLEALAAARIPHAPINDIYRVREIKAIRDKLTRTVTPQGRPLHLPPMAVDLPDGIMEYPFAPRYGEHTEPILREVGLSMSRILELRTNGVIP